jgi:hypothetical protein
MELAPSVYCDGAFFAERADTRFARWAKNGAWERVFNALIQDRKNEYLMLDTTLVRAHQQAATGKGGTKNQALGRSRGGLTTKIHKWWRMRCASSSHQARPGDITQAPALLEG